MNFWVGVTDNKWFDFLARLAPDEVNFWQPSGRMPFRSLQEGAPFLFKLHSPLNFIAGGGFFVRFLALPLSLAWDAFHEKNGAASLETLKALITSKLRDSAVKSVADPVIGCSILACPFFFPRNQWIPVPADWSTYIVQGKSYDSREESGARLWALVEERLNFGAVTGSLDLQGASISGEEGERYGSPALVRARLGQGAFRVLVTEAYHRRCAIDYRRAHSARAGIRTHQALFEIRSQQGSQRPPLARRPPQAI